VWSTVTTVRSRTETAGVRLREAQDIREEQQRSVALVLRIYIVPVRRSRLQVSVTPGDADGQPLDPHVHTRLREVPERLIERGDHARGVRWGDLPGERSC
jgi:hypothetical protein